MEAMFSTSVHHLACLLGVPREIYRKITIPICFSEMPKTSFSIYLKYKDMYMFKYYNSIAH